MKRPRMAPEARTKGQENMLLALGGAGWALSAELLMVLVEKKILSDKAALKIMRGAADCLQAMYEISHDPVFDAARDTVDGQIEGWQRADKDR